MDFGSEFVYAPEKDDQEFDYIEETRYNHKTKGYSSVSADYKDDGEVSSTKKLITVICLIFILKILIFKFSTGKFLFIQTLLLETTTNLISHYVNNFV